MSQLNLFTPDTRHLLLEEKKFQAFEFLRSSLVWLDRCKYKSVGKHMVQAWAKAMRDVGLVDKIEIESVKLSVGRQSTQLLITFPWDGPHHISIWLDNHKTKFEDLKDSLLKFKEHAKKELNIKEKS